MVLESGRSQLMALLFLASLCVLLLTAVSTTPATGSTAAAITQVNTTLSYTFGARLALGMHATVDGSCSSIVASELPVLLSVLQATDGAVTVRQDMALHGQNILRGNLDTPSRHPRACSTRMPFWLQNVSPYMSNFTDTVPNSVAECSCRGTVSRGCTIPLPPICDGDSEDVNIVLNYTATPLSLFLNIAANGSISAHRVWNDIHGREQCSSLLSGAEAFTEEEATTAGFYRNQLATADLWLYHAAARAMPQGENARTIAHSFALPSEPGQVANFSAQQSCTWNGDWSVCEDTSMSIASTGPTATFSVPTRIQASGSAAWSNGPDDYAGGGDFSFTRTFEEPVREMLTKPPKDSLPTTAFFELPAACR